MVAKKGSGAVAELGLALYVRLFRMMKSPVLLGRCSGRVEVRCFLWPLIMMMMEDDVDRGGWLTVLFARRRGRLGAGVIGENKLSLFSPSCSQRAAALKKSVFG